MKKTLKLLSAGIIIAFAVPMFASANLNGNSDKSNFKKMTTEEVIERINSSENLTNEQKAENVEQIRKRVIEMNERRTEREILKEKYGKTKKYSKGGSKGRYTKKSKYSKKGKTSKYSKKRDYSKKSKNGNFKRRANRVTIEEVINNINSSAKLTAEQKVEKIERAKMHFAKKAERIANKASRVANKGKYTKKSRKGTYSKKGNKAKFSKKGGRSKFKKMTTEEVVARINSSKKLTAEQKAAKVTSVRERAEANIAKRAERRASRVATLETIKETVQANTTLSEERKSEILRKLSLLLSRYSN